VSPLTEAEEQQQLDSGSVLQTAEALANPLAVAIMRCLPGTPVTRERELACKELQRRAPIVFDFAGTICRYATVEVIADRYMHKRLPSILRHEDPVTALGLVGPLPFDVPASIAALEDRLRERRLQPSVDEEEVAPAISAEAAALAAAEALIAAEEERESASAAKPRRAKAKKLRRKTMAESDQSAERATEPQPAPEESYEDAEATHEEGIDTAEATPEESILTAAAPQLTLDDDTAISPSAHMNFDNDSIIAPPAQLMPVFSADSECGKSLHAGAWCTSCGEALTRVFARDARFADARWLGLAHDHDEDRDESGLPADANGQVLACGDRGHRVESTLVATAEHARVIAVAPCKSCRVLAYIS
jgi:hypothetical protein